MKSKSRLESFPINNKFFDNFFSKFDTQNFESILKGNVDEFI